MNDVVLTQDIRKGNRFTKPSGNSKVRKGVLARKREESFKEAITFGLGFEGGVES